MYYVSRQHYYYSGESIVEVAQGGIDYAGADMLVKKYEGEAQEYANPVEAAEAAINIRKHWQKDYPDKVIGIAIGNNHGFGLEFEPSSDEEVLAIAKELYEKMAKCDACGELIEEKWTLIDYDDFHFCSEYCCEKFVAENEIQNEEAECD